MTTEHDKSISRLVITLHKLSTNELPTINELAEEFNVNIRTIQRDIYERLHYFPIEKDSQGRLKFIDGFSLGRTTFDNNELLLTYLGLSQLKNINDDFNKNIDNVLKKIFNPGYSSIIHIKPENFEELDIDSTIFDTLEFCIKNTLICELQLKNKYILVEPYKILNLEGIWYLLALDKNDLKIKSYLLSKISNVNESNTKFKKRDDLDEIISNVHSGFFEDGSSIIVKVRIYSPISQYFKLKEFLPTQNIIEELKDGSLIVTFEVTHYEDIDNIVKSWIPHIEVLEPSDYKDKFIDELENYLEKLTNKNNITFNF